MTVREFDNVTTGTVDYEVYDRENFCVATFTRDVLQEIETYQRNMEKFERYADARIKWVYSMNDIIRVKAVID